MPTVTTQDLRTLLASGGEPVVYVAVDDDGKPSIDVWVDAYVLDGRIVVTRGQLVDDLGHNPTDGDLGNYAATLQAVVEDIVKKL